MVHIDEPLYQSDFFKSNVEIYEGIETIPDMDTFNRDFNHLIIFDDMICETKSNQKPIEEYYIRGRLFILLNSIS
jgi:hypothetical protein